MTTTNKISLKFLWLLTFKPLGHFFNVFLFPIVVHYKCNILYETGHQYNEYLLSTVDTDDLVIQHQGINSHSDEYAPMRFQLFMG